MMIIEDPSVATAAGTSVCTAALVSGETVNESMTDPGTANNFSSTYTFKITSDTD